MSFTMYKKISIIKKRKKAKKAAKRVFWNIFSLNKLKTFYTPYNAERESLKDYKNNVGRKNYYISCCFCIIILQ